MAITFATNSLRFEDVRSQIVDFLLANSDYSGTFDWKGSNASYMIDAMAYISMMMSYQLTNTANNMFLDTTNDRKNTVSLAKSIGYTPKRAVSSKFFGTFRYNGLNFTPNDFFIIPANNEFISSAGRLYLNLEPITIKYTGNPNYLEAEFTLTEGQFKQFSILGTGKPLQNFNINSLNIEDNNFNLYVRDVNTELLESNKANYKWEKANSFAAIVNGGNFYFIEEDSLNEGTPRIVFGNGTFGNIPSIKQIIHIEYLQTNGAAANNEYLVIIPNIDKFESNGMTISLGDFDQSYKSIISYGGSNLETINDIKNNAPRFFATVNKLITKNDYTTYINQQTAIPVNSANIVTSDDFVYENLVAGKIFVTAIPKLLKNINYTKNLYLTEKQEQELLFNIKKYSIIATEHFFYKPTIILIDFDIETELVKTLSIADKSITNNAIKSSVQTSIYDTYQELGKLYRQSKINSYVDYFTNVISSDLTQNVSFLLNYDSFYASSNSVNNFSFLPLIATSFDQSGKILTYTQFVQSNAAAADYEIFDLYGVDVNSLIISNTVSAVPDITTKRLEQFELTPVSGSTINGNLYHSYINRILTNNDITSNKIIEFEVLNNVVSNVTKFDFYNLFSDLTTVNVTSSGNSHVISFTTNSVVYENVATITFNSLLTDKFVISSASASAMETQGIIQYPTSGSYLYVTKNFITNKYEISLNMIGNKVTSDLRVAGNMKMFAFDLNQIDVSYQFIDQKNLSNTNQLKIPNTIQSETFNFGYNNFDLYTIITNDVSGSNKGYISTQTDIVTVLASSPTTGDYYIIRNDNLLRLEINGIYGSFNNKVLFYNGAWVIKDVLREIDATIESSLDTIYNYGDTLTASVSGIEPIPVSAGDVVIKGISGWEKANLKATPIPASGSLPENITDFNKIKMIVDVQSISTDLDGQLSTPAIEYDIIANIPSSGWNILCNTLATSGLPTHDASVTLPISGNAGEVRLVISTNGGDFNGSSNVVFPINSVENIAYDGDLIICLNGLSWWVFNEDISQILSALDPYSLPSEILFGDMYSLSASGDFNGLMETLEISDKIIYISGTEFRKVNTTTYNPTIGILSNPTEGTIFGISKSGNFGNSLPDTYYKSDKIIFTKQTWQKLEKYSVYAIETEAVILANIAENGFNINPYIKFNPTTNYYEVYLKDIFNNTKIGTVNYITGKITYESMLAGFIDNEITSTITIKEFFNNYNSIVDQVWFDRINVIPVYKTDLLGNIIKEFETDFDTVFNQYIVGFVNSVNSP